MFTLAEDEHRPGCLQASQYSDSESLLLSPTADHCDQVERCKEFSSSHERKKDVPSLVAATCGASACKQSKHCSRATDRRPTSKLYEGTTCRRRRRRLPRSARVRTTFAQSILRANIEVVGWFMIEISFRMFGNHLLVNSEQGSGGMQSLMLRIEIIMAVSPETICKSQDQSVFWIKSMW